MLLKFLGLEIFQLQKPKQNMYVIYVQYSILKVECAINKSHNISIRKQSLSWKKELIEIALNADLEPPRF